MFQDVGKSILESYSRVLESLAFNIVARIDDLLYVDDLTKHSDQFSSISKVGLLAQNGPPMSYSVPVPCTPYKTAFTTPSFSPAHLVSPARGDRSPFIASGKIPQRGLGVKKVLTDYLSIETKGNIFGSSNGKADSISKTTHGIIPGSQAGTEPSDSRKTTSPSIRDRFERDDI